MSREQPDIRIVERGAIRILQIGRVQQSSMYLDAPFVTDFDLSGLPAPDIGGDTPSETRNVIGLGGATVVRRMWRDYPWMHIDAVELDPRVAEIAKTHFALPEDERIAVHVGEDLYRDGIRSGDVAPYCDGHG